MVIDMEVAKLIRGQQQFFRKLNFKFQTGELEYLREFRHQHFRFLFFDRLEGKELEDFIELFMDYEHEITMKVISEYFLSNNILYKLHYDRLTLSELLFGGRTIITYFINKRIAKKSNKLLYELYKIKSNKK